MTDHHNIIGIKPESIEYDASKGLGVNAKVYSSPDMTKGDVKKKLKERFGDRVSFDEDEPVKSPRNMARAAFSASRWNSPWVPQGDKDRADKPPYDPSMN